MLAGRLRTDARLAFTARERDIGQRAMWYLIRREWPSVIDRRWAQHLAGLGTLFERLGWPGAERTAARDEYQRQADELYEMMLAGISEDTVMYLFTDDPGSTPARSGQQNDG